MATIKEKFKSEVPAHTIYKEEVAEVAENVNPVTDVPRNLKQIQNAKVSVKHDSRYSRDALINAHELAFSIPGFVHYIATFPDLVMVVGTEVLLQEMEEVIRLPSMCQMLSYDTTFNLGEFYVSPLLFRHTAFVNNPVLMAAAMIHERKLETHHRLFFQTIFKHVKHKAVPIATDDEQALINAIRIETDLFRVGCQRHLVNDIKHWVDNHDGNKDDRIVYVDEVLELIACDSFKSSRNCTKRNERHGVKHLLITLGLISSGIRRTVGVSMRRPDGTMPNTRISRWRQRISRCVI
jgi:hypothetical protein